MNLKGSRVTLWKIIIIGRRIEILYVVGKSSDNKEVYAGVYKFQNTHGLPLTQILETFKDQDKLICWKHYINEALFYGKRIESIKIEIINSIIDSEFISKDELKDFEMKLAHIGK